MTKSYSGVDAISSDELLNGHVFYLYHVKSSLTKTKNAVNSKFSGEGSD